MKPEIILKHEFVDFVPEELEQGTIYVSVRFATASHLCVCGCGNKVVTPIRPTDWKLIFDGKTVSLDPSIGNWGFPCQSHYFIRNNRVKWAPHWSKEQIQRGRVRDAHAKQNYFTAEEGESTTETNDPATKPGKKKKGGWRKLKLW